MEIQEVAFRPVEEEDKSFILNSWLKSYRDSDFAKHMANPVYFSNHANIINNLLSRCTVIVAHNPEESKQIYGYIVFENVRGVCIVHYVYVKFPYRRFKIGTNLFRFAQPNDKEFSLISHYPKGGQDTCKKFNLIYDLYKLA